MEKRELCFVVRIEHNMRRGIGKTEDKVSCCIWSLLGFNSLYLSNTCGNLDAACDLFHKFNGDVVYFSSVASVSDVRTDYYVYGFIGTVSSRSE